MNFFAVGFLLCALNFNMGWELNYIVRAAGTVFMLSGIKEADQVSDGFSKYKKLLLTVGVFSLLGLGAMLLLRYGVIPQAAENVSGIFFGSITAALVLISQRKVLRHITERHELVNDPSLLEGIYVRWKKYAVSAAVSVAFDVIYRILPVSDIQAAAGVVEIISRIVMYVYVITFTVAFAKAAHDFNIMHPIR